MERTNSKRYLKLFQTFNKNFYWDINDDSLTLTVKTKYFNDVSVIIKIEDEESNNEDILVIELENESGLIVMELRNILDWFIDDGLKMLENGTPKENDIFATIHYLTNYECN